MAKIKHYKLNNREMKNEKLHEQGKEDLDQMAETFQKIVNHYKSQGVEFWYEIDKEAPMNECVCYISETEETFQKEIDEGMACMPGNAIGLISCFIESEGE